MLWGARGEAQGIPSDREDSLKASIQHFLENEQIDSAFQVNASLISYYSEKGDDYELVRQHVNRAEILRMIGGLEEALNTLSKVEATCLELPASTVKSAYFNRKAAILFEMKRPYQSLEAVHQSQAIDSLKGYRWRLFSNLNLEGAIYRDTKQYDKAKKTLQQSLSLAREEADSSEWASAAYNLTLLNFRSKDFKSSIGFGREYLEVAPIHVNSISYGDILHILSEAYAQLGQFDSAFFFNDSAFGVRMVHMQSIIEDNVNKYEIVNELEKERLQNSVLKAEKERSNLQIGILALAVLVALLLIYFANKQRVVYKKSSKKEKAYNKELEQSLEFKNKLISIVAHDIRNPMASLKGLIQVYNEGLVEERDLKTMMSGLEASVTNVDLLLENLLNWVRSQSESLNPYLETVELKPLVNNAIAEAGPQLKAKSIKVLVQDLDGHEKLVVDQNFLAFILRNLLSNAIKFSKSGKEIEISCQHDDQYDCLIIKDHGRGMNPDTLKRINSQESILKSSTGTNKEKGTGLGLALCKEFLEKLNGKMRIESALGSGTTVKVYLPRKLPRLKHSE